MNKIFTLLALFCLLNHHRAHITVSRPHPTAAPTIGFFLDSWSGKEFTPPAFQPATTASREKDEPVLTIDPDSVITLIPPGEFGHNIDTWAAGMVLPQLLYHITNLQPHVIRWPAGSGSDAYFWNAGPGGLPADAPASIVNKDGKKEPAHYYYGRPLNGFASLDNYYEMLKLTGSEGLITVNYGYARYGTGSDPVATAAHLAADWVRYDHGRTRYWEVGNENSGSWEYGYRIDSAGNSNGQPIILSGALYGKHFRVFADSMRKAAAEVGNRIYIGAVTVEAPPHPWDPPLTRNWNNGMIPAAGDCADFYVVHNYFTPYNKNSSAAEILHAAATVPGEQMRFVMQSLHDNGATVKPIAMDEWNMFATGSRQQVSNVSGLFSVIILGEALRNKYGLLARWDLINGWNGGNDHGLFSAGDEPGVARWSPRPSFYYLYYLQRLMGDRIVESTLSGDTALKAYASTFSSGEVSAAIVNPGVAARNIQFDIRHFQTGKQYYWYTLSGDASGDTSRTADEFPRRVVVNGRTTDAAAGGPSDYTTLPAFAAPAAKGIRVRVPARGAIFLVVESDAH